MSIAECRGHECNAYDRYKEKQEETVSLLVTEQPVPYKFCHFSSELFSEQYSNTARALPKTQIRDKQHGPHTQFTYVCAFNFLY